MEKNTKILLGVGAVIAAYLILKAKKAAAQTDVVSTPKITLIPNNGDDVSGTILMQQGIPYMPRVTESTPDELLKQLEMWKLNSKRRGCACITTPCNC
jgi:hypothetical protein